MAKYHVALIHIALMSLIGISRGQQAYPGSPCLGTTCDNGLACLAVTGEVCNSTDLLSTLCTCGGIGEILDPFFTGFSGQQFYFPAEAGEIYNLFIAKNYLINARFIDNRPKDKPAGILVASEAEHSSFIGAVSLWHGDTRVEVSCDDYGKMSVLVNEAELSLDQHGFDFGVGQMLGEDVMLQVEGIMNELAHSLTLETELLLLTIRAEDYHVNNLGYTVKGHLNVQLSLKTNRLSAPPAHGILGQTVDASLVAEQQDAFPGEGRASDYAVSSLFGADFKLNLFNGDKVMTQEKGATRQQVHVSRRLLVELEEPRFEGEMQSASVEPRLE